MAKAGLADAIRQATSGPDQPAKPGYAPVTDAAEVLLRANEEAGTIRPGVSSDDLLLAIAGLWQIDPRGDWQPRVARLLGFVMDGLRVGAPDGERVGPPAWRYDHHRGTRLRVGILAAIACAPCSASSTR